MPVHIRINIHNLAEKKLSRKTTTTTTMGHEQMRIKYIRCMCVCAFECCIFHSRNFRFILLHHIYGIAFTWFIRLAFLPSLAVCETMGPYIFIGTRMCNFSCIPCKFFLYTQAPYIFFVFQAFLHWFRSILSLARTKKRLSM